MISQRATRWFSKHVVTPLHASFVSSSRIEKLSRNFLRLLPEGNLEGLDVGCGTGELAMRIQESRQDVRITGVDVLIRDNSAIKVLHFDGQTLPFPDKSYDFVLISDVLHHTDNPDAMLKECARVARSFVLIKDHISNTAFDRSTLTFMDWVGNRGHDVALTYNYLSSRDWKNAYLHAGLCPDRTIEDLSLYPQPFTLLFDRRLHFISRLTVS